MPCGHRLAGCAILVASDEDLAAAGADPDAQLRALRATFGERPGLVVTAGIGGAWIDAAGRRERIAVTRARCATSRPSAPVTRSPPECCSRSVRGRTSPRPRAPGRPSRPDTSPRGLPRRPDSSAGGARRRGRAALAAPRPPPIAAGVAAGHQPAAAPAPSSRIAPPRPRAKARSRTRDASAAAASAPAQVAPVSLTDPRHLDPCRCRVQ